MTGKVDGTKESTLNAMMQEMKGPTTMVWGSIPCTGGTAWKRLNDVKYGEDPEYRKKMREHEKRFSALWDNFVQIAEHVLSGGGTVAFEWPTGCHYWRKHRVKEFLKRHHLRKVDFHGCAVGLKSSEGQPIKKPWTVATNSFVLREALKKKRCECDVPHALAEGKETKRTGSYPSPMARLVHKAFQYECAQKNPVGVTQDYWARGEGGSDDVWIRVHKSLRDEMYHHEDDEPCPFGLDEVDCVVVEQHHINGDSNVRMFNTQGDLNRAVDHEVPWEGVTRYHMKKQPVMACPATIADNGERSSDAGIEDDTYPRMPVMTSVPEHRQKIAPGLEWSAMVTKQLTNDEILKDPKAKAAMDKEWNRHAGKTWDTKGVRELDDVIREAKAKGETIHIGRVFGIAGIKGHELPEGHPQRKYKGRYVFQGNNVKDQDGNWAIFQELGASPASMEASKLVDFVSLLPGNTMKQSDAEMAYVQARLRGHKTWVILPRDRWQPEWGKYRMPVCPLLMALYGHPDAGGDWEDHCCKQIVACGWRPIPDWPSAYYHPATGCFLAIYVDDFKMAGPAKHIDNLYASLQQRIKMDDPSEVDRFLGCHHRYMASIQHAGKTIRRLQYDMGDFLASAVKMYYELAGPNAKPLKQVPTPYIPDQELTQGQITEATPADKEYEIAPVIVPAQNLQSNKKQQQIKAWGKDTILLSRWVRVDKQAKAFRTTNKNGPPWSQVVRRVTVDLDTD